MLPLSMKKILRFEPIATVEERILVKEKEGMLFQDRCASFRSYVCLVSATLK